MVSVRNFKYTYIIYQNDFPIYTCESLEGLAKFFKIKPINMRWKTNDFKKRCPEETKIYSYKDELTGLMDYSQKCFANSKLEIYKFWSEKNENK